MSSGCVSLKAGLAALFFGGIAPVLASSADQQPVPASGAPATAEEQVIGRSFNFSPDDVTDQQRMIDGRFNYRPALDALTVQPAK